MAPEPIQHPLHSYREDRPLEDQPELADAYRKAQGDPALRQQLDNDQAFDRAFRQSLSELPPPTDLLEKIFSLAPSSSPSSGPSTTKEISAEHASWWRRSPAIISLAASLLLLLTLTIFALNPQRLAANSAELSQFFEEVCKPPCEPLADASILTDDLLTIQAYLQESAAPLPRLYPLGAHTLEPIGSQVIAWKGIAVTQICLLDEYGQHAHLYASHQGMFPDDELSQEPQYFQQEGYSYAVWSHADTVCVFVVRGDIDNLRRYL